MIFLDIKIKQKLFHWVLTKKFFLSKRKKKFKNLTISYFGRITPIKGIHVLINALKLLEKDKWNLIIDIDHIEDKEYFIKLKNKLKKYFQKIINLLNVIIMKLLNT